MPKISSANAKSLLIKYIIKILLSSFFSVLLLSAAVSFAVLKLDIDTDVLKYASVVICGVSGFITAFISTLDFKNNLIVLSLVSVLPLLIFCVANFVANGTQTIFILIKIVVIIAAAVIVSLIRCSKKFR